MNGDSIRAAGVLLTECVCPHCGGDAQQDDEAFGRDGEPEQNIEIGFVCTECEAFSYICATVRDLRIEHVGGK